MILYIHEEEKPKDWAFMEKSSKVLSCLPTTWKQYSQNELGRMKIIEMEFNELKNAPDLCSQSQKLIHLASACLHLWRYINHAE